MPKSFRNKFKKAKHSLTHNKISNNAKIGVEILPIGNLPISHKNQEALARGLNPVQATEDFIAMRGTKKGKKVGQILETLGSGASTIGTLTGQPEISAIGTGLTIAGGYEKGETAGEIIGNAVGSYVGGKLGGSSVAGQLIGSQIGGKMGEKVITGIEGVVDGRNGNRTHHDQLKTQIAENSHKSDQLEHHNNTSLSNDLKASGDFKTGSVGETIQNQEHHATSQEGQELENELQQLETTNDVLSFLVNNLPVIMALQGGDRDEILDEVLDSGLLDQMLANV